MTIGIYPPMFHWLRKYGIYVLRFQKDYEWKYVIVDDFFPSRVFSYKSPELIMASCRNKNEFWVPFIEKAYAKLHGSYQSLISG